MSAEEKAGESRTERKKEKTRQKILTSAINLFKKQGIDVTTMEQIAEEVDIAKTTLYNYFSNKEAIISEFMQRSFKEKNFRRIMKFKDMPDTRSRMILIFEELIEGIQGHKEIFERYLVYRMQKVISFHQHEPDRSGFNLLRTEIIKMGQKDSEIRDDLPLHVLEELFEFAFIEAVKQFYIEPANFDGRQFIESCVDLFLNGAKRN
ncbi:TetR/AcrR family transcriptional regulator [Candidatus Contubernalis alkaliaceticus]|uniref:TetR/AcrR family transcriptional regulator n=1 Tax=Candidatus Contubernalis alkaliaceticus TaxID=338645 RepID=UPI001F4C21E8|nr:TetR/AcrR family transcriptional regulator [Candidatus Contubernalis alkalaceticus]UNC92079.1 TetR/AcrR family transcriptional regulator [Candidatus Contubernalis alkalaceticus]